MSQFNRTLKISIIVLLMSFSFAAISITPAFAADAPTDLSVSLNAATSDQLYGLLTCNEGSTTVKSITFDRSFTNYTPTRAISLPTGFFGINATDSGNYDDNIKTWTGVLEGGQCIALGFSGDITGPTGGSVSFTASIVSSVLSDDSLNVDPNSANDSITPVLTPIVDLPNMAIETRLLTTGSINSGSSVSYEITISNNGIGSYVVSPTNDLPLGIYFVMPVGSALQGLVDDDLTDTLQLNNAECFEASTALIGPGLDDLYPGQVAGCSFIANSYSFEPGESKTFTATFTAGASFASGATSVWAIVIGDNPRSMFFQIDAMTGTDVFADLSTNTDNLVYDGNALQVTVNRCPGQAETTTNGTGCFRVSFNKLIYAPSFVEADLVLGGGGEVDTFSQLDDYTWEVRIKNIPKGALFTLSLDPESVQDYSAVMNGISVLGENTIRFLDDSTLPETGKNVDWHTPIFLMMLGLTILKLSRKQNSIIR